MTFMIKNNSHQALKTLKNEEMEEFQKEINIISLDFMYYFSYLLKELESPQCYPMFWNNGNEKRRNLFGNGTRYKRNIVEHASEGGFDNSTTHGNVGKVVIEM